MALTDQTFLFCCIDNSNNGTVNWQKVADECGISTKGAAAMKYRRMKEKFGTASANGTNSPDGAKTVARSEGDGEAEKTTKTKKTPAKKPSKKRKKSEDDDAETNKVKAEEDDLA